MIMVTVLCAVVQVGVHWFVGAAFLASIGVCARHD